MNRAGLLTSIARNWIRLLRTQTVTVTFAISPALPVPTANGPLTRQQRAHYRLSWTERLARNASSELVPSTAIHLFGIPTVFARSLGLAVV